MPCGGLGSQTRWTTMTMNSTAEASVSSGATMGASVACAVTTGQTTNPDLMRWLAHGHSIRLSKTQYLGRWKVRQWSDWKGVCNGSNHWCRCWHLRKPLGPLWAEHLSCGWEEWGPHSGVFRPSSFGAHQWPIHTQILCPPRLPQDYTIQVSGNNWHN